MQILLDIPEHICHDAYEAMKRDPQVVGDICLHNAIMLALSDYIAAHPPMKPRDATTVNADVPFTSAGNAVEEPGK